MISWFVTSPLTCYINLITLQQFKLLTTILHCCLSNTTTNSILTTRFAGWWQHDVTCEMDASRKRHVPEVHCRVGRMEFRCRNVGNFHLRQTTLVRAIQSRGMYLSYFNNSWTWGWIEHVSPYIYNYCGCISWIHLRVWIILSVPIPLRLKLFRVHLQHFAHIL